MLKLVLLSALCAVVMAGYGHQGGYGHGHSHGHYGWRRPYYGWANVNVWQTPYGYQFGLNEQGKGYNKYIWQGADYHHSVPVKYPTYGHSRH